MATRGLTARRSAQGAALPPLADIPLDAGRSQAASARDVALGHEIASCRFRPRSRTRPLPAAKSPQAAQAACSFLQQLPSMDAPITSILSMAFVTSNGEAPGKGFTYTSMSSRRLDERGVGCCRQLGCCSLNSSQFTAESLRSRSHARGDRMGLHYILNSRIPRTPSCIVLFTVDMR